MTSIILDYNLTLFPLLFVLVAILALMLLAVGAMLYQLHKQVKESGWQERNDGRTGNNSLDNRSTGASILDSSFMDDLYS